MDTTTQPNNYPMKKYSRTFSRFSNFLLDGYQNSFSEVEMNTFLTDTFEFFDGLLLRLLAFQRFLLFEAIEFGVHYTPFWLSKTFAETTDHPNTQNTLFENHNRTFVFVL